MANGLPIYASGSGYQGDETIADVRKERDSRLNVFLKEPGQKNVLFESVEGEMAVPVEPYPVILNNNAEKDIQQVIHSVKEIIIIKNM